MEEIVALSFPLYSKTKICSRDADTVTLWTWLRSERSVQERKIIWHVYMLSNPKSSSPFKNPLQSVDEAILKCIRTKGILRKFSVQL